MNSRGELGYILEGIEDEMARQRMQESQFTSDTGRMAITKRWKEDKENVIRPPGRSSLLFPLLPSCFPLLPRCFHLLPAATLCYLRYPESCENYPPLEDH